MEAMSIKKSSGVGTASAVTTATTALAMGTSQPTLILDFGVWLVFARVVAGQVDATCLGTETLTVSVKDALGNVISTTSVLLTEGTTLGLNLGTILLPIAIHTNDTPDMTPDTLHISAVLSANPSAGSITITEAELVAIRLK